MVLSIGEILVDIFADGENKRVFPGGAPFNLACNIKKFKGDVSFYGAVGKDEYGNSKLRITLLHKNFNFSISPLTSPGEGVTVFTSPYLSAGASALGKVKGLIFHYNVL